MLLLAVPLYNWFWGVNISFSLFSRREVWSRLTGVQFKGLANIQIFTIVLAFNRDFYARPIAKRFSSADDGQIGIPIAFLSLGPPAGSTVGGI